MLPVEEARERGVPDPSLEGRKLHGLLRPDDTLELDAMARAIAVAVAGSFSGGESTHRSSGFMSSVLDFGAGVPGLRWISIEGVELSEGCGKARLGP